MLEKITSVTAHTAIVAGNAINNSITAKQAGNVITGSNLHYSPNSRSYSGGTIRTWNPTAGQKWEMSNNLFARLSYGFSDAFWITVQNILLKPIVKNITHIGGGLTNPKENVDAFVSSAPFLLPAADVEGITAETIAEEGVNLTKPQLKSISSLERQIEKHEEKLAKYIENPTKFDNKEFLKKAPNDVVRQKIIQSRINHLQNEIQTFKDNIQKIINGG